MAETFLQARALTLSCALLVWPSSGLEPGSVPRQPRFRTNAEMVLLQVRVEDGEGRPVTGLGVEDLAVDEDGVSQEIIFFRNEAGEAATPSSIVLAIDTSSSMKGTKLADAKRAASGFIRESPPESEIAVVAFDHEVRQVCDFAPRREAALASVERLTSGGGTALYDAMLHSLVHLERAGRERPVLVVLSDGNDLDSQTPVSELERQVETSSVVIYAVGHYSRSERELFLTGRRYLKEPELEVNLNPAWVLRRLAVETGGRAFFPRQDEEIQPLFSTIASELRHHYVVGYEPPPAEAEPRFRRIAVRVRETPASAGSLRVRARRGYVR